MSNSQTHYKNLHGSIKSNMVLKGKITRTIEKVERQTKEVEITENGTTEVVPDANKALDKVIINTDIIGGNAEEYNGSYEVTPKLEEQTLQTAKKVMREDVTIKEIPIFTVTNSSGGNTIIIGG